MSGGRSPASVALLDRDAELRDIDALVADVEAGQGRAALITAPAGLGKSALLDVLEVRASERGWHVRRAAHAREERDLPLSVVRTLLEAPLLARPELAAGHAAAGRAAGLLLEGAGGDPMATDVAHGVFWLCTALAADQPLVLLIDDAQWSDLPSLRVLAYLARRVADLRLLLVCAVRTVDGVSPDASPIAGTAPDLFAGIRDVVAITPGPLGPAAATELVRTAAPGAEKDGAAGLAAEGRGVPWLLLELAAAEPAGSPLVRRRLAWLAEPERRLARALAILGDDVDPLLLSELTGIAVTRLATVYEGLEAAGLAEGDGWRLVHPVIGRAALATTRAGTLERLHGAAARGLAQRRAPVGRVAEHLLRCPPSADPEASATLRAAAEEAAGRGEPALAAAHLERALLERAPGDDRAAMLAQLGALRFHAGDDDARSRLEQGIAESRDEDVRVELLTRLSALEIVDPYLGDEQLEAHLSDVGATDGDLRFAAELAALDALIVRPDRHAERARRTRALDPEATSDAELRAAALAHRAWQGMEAGDRDAAEIAQVARRSIAAEEMVETAGRRAAYHLSVRTLIYADDLDAAADAITRLRTFAAEQGSVRLMITARWYASELALRAGRLADAEREARAALASLDPGDIMGAGPLEVLVLVLAERGELCAAADELAARESVWREPTGWEAGVRHARARVLLAEGRYAEAEEQAHDAGRLRAAQGRPNPSWTPWRSTAALALAHRGRIDEAAALADEELGLAGRFDAPVAIAVAEHARCVAEPDPAARAQRAAAALERPIPAALARARLEVELGAALVRLRRRTEAREPLRSALALADAVGAAPLAERARRELVASGARPRRAAVAGVRALTPRQRQIAELAAAGRANREIADELFLSVKTVETHLAAVFEKLGVTERGELAEALGGTAAPGEP